MDQEIEFINFELNLDKNYDIVKLDEIDDIDDENTCGIGEEEIKPVLKKINNKNNCYKCKSNRSNYYNRNEFICKDCFLKNINHKFRSNLRAHCKIRHEDYVLVCINGNNNSMAMLHWFYSTFNDNTSKRKLFFKLKVLYVDDSCSILQSKEEVLKERIRRHDFIKNICDKFNFAFDIIYLENIFKIIYENKRIMENDLINNKDFNIESIGQFMSLYSKLSKIGNFANDFINIITRNSIFYYALTYNFSKIVFADSGQGLVNNIFNTVVKGRGYSLRENIGYVDTHFIDGRITILRPLRDFLTKEVLLYNYINDIDVLYPSSTALNNSNTNSKVSIPFSGNTNALVNFFFNNLQNRMGSTVTTVLGTAEKLKLKDQEKIYKENNSICVFCLNYIDNVENALEIGSIDIINNE